MKKVFSTEMLELIGLGNYEEVVAIPIEFSENYNQVVLRSKGRDNEEVKLICIHVIEVSMEEERDENLPQRRVDGYETAKKIRYKDKVFTFMMDVYEIPGVEGLKQLINFNNFILGSLQNYSLPCDKNTKDEDIKIRKKANEILRDIIEDII